jgi:predicted dehydrogenase
MRRLRLGIAGLGRAFSLMVPAFTLDPRVEIAAGADPRPEARSKFEAQFGAKAFDSVEKLAAQPGLDAVYVATPHQFHAAHTSLAASFGKHVLVEKPMAMSVAECDQMIDACRSADVRLGVAYYRRFYPLVARMRQLLDGGSIGTPLAISAVTATPFAISPGEQGYWRVDPDQGGGGALMDIGSHRIDIFRYFFGEIAEVQAFCATLAADYSAEDSVVVALQFEQGPLGTLQCHFGSTADPDELAILGTRGRLVARPLNGSTLIWENQRNQQTETHVRPSNLCGPLIQDFVEAIRTGREPRVPGTDGRATNWVMEQAYRVAKKRILGS